MLIQELDESQTLPKQHLPRCAGIAIGGIGNLSEKDEELLWRKN